jgi:hypothetical protein
MNDLEASLRNLLGFLATEKSTAVNRMHTSFNWAFGILSVFIVGIASRQDFQTKYLSLFLFSVAFVLLNHFFVRTAKDYLNQIRFAALEKACLACLFSIKIENAETGMKELSQKVDCYFIQWRSPKPVVNVLNKTLFDHGFFALFVVVLTMIIWVGIKINWNDLRPIATILVAVGLVVVILKDFGGYYFECDKEESLMKGKD